MRKIKLSPHEIRLFSTEIDGLDYHFFKKHTDAFKRMWEEQGREFWEQFIICYRAFSINCGVLKEFPVKSEQYEVFIDEAFRFIRQEYIRGKVNHAKQFVNDTAALAHHKGSLGGLESTSYSKDPFYHKETRDIFRRFFGNPKEKSSYIKVYLLLPLYLSFGGSVCTCLRNWLDAEDGESVCILPTEEDLRPKWAKKDKSNTVADLMQLANPDKSYRVVEDKDEEKLILTFLYEQNKRREMGAKTFRDLEEYRKHLHEERMDSDGRISQYVDPKGDGNLIDLSKATEPWWRDEDKKSKKHKKNKFSDAQQEAVRDSMAGEADNGISVCIGTPRPEDDDMDVNDYLERIAEIPKAYSSLAKMNRIVEENNAKIRGETPPQRAKKFRAVRTQGLKSKKSTKITDSRTTKMPDEDITIAEYLDKLQAELPPGQMCPFKLTPDGKGACLTMSVTVQTHPKDDDREEPPFEGGWQALLDKLERVADPDKQEEGANLLKKMVSDVGTTGKSTDGSLARLDNIKDDDPAYEEYLYELKLRKEYMERNFKKGKEITRRVNHIFTPKVENAVKETFKRYGANVVEVIRPQVSDSESESNDSEDSTDTMIRKLEAETEVNIPEGMREEFKRDFVQCQQTMNKAHKVAVAARSDVGLSGEGVRKKEVVSNEEKPNCLYDENLIGAHDELIMFKKNIEGQLNEKKGKLHKMSNEDDEKKTGRVIVGMGFNVKEENAKQEPCEGCKSGKHDRDVCVATRHFQRLDEEAQDAERGKANGAKNGDKSTKAVSAGKPEEKKKSALHGKDIKCLVVQRSSGKINKETKEGFLTEKNWLWKLECGGTCLNDDGTYNPIRVEARDFAKWFNKEIHKSEEEINSRPYLVCVFTEDEEVSGTMAKVMKQLYDMKVEATLTGGRVSQEGIRNMSKLVHGGMKCASELKAMEGMKQLQREEEAKAKVKKMEARRKGTVPDADSEAGKKNGKPKNCYGCGKLEPKPKEFKKCQKCREQNVKQPRYYCCRDCQVKDWTDRHKKEHKEWKTVEEPM